MGQTVSCGVRREEAGNRYCIVLLLILLSGPRQDVCRCIMAHVRTDGCPWTHRIGCRTQNDAGRRSQYLFASVMAVLGRGHRPSGSGTHTVVVGYSLGANSSVFVANTAKYVDLIIALQPSMLSWNPPVTGKVGRMIEIYNPNPWMTFGGMGSKKLIGRKYRVHCKL